MANKVLIKKGKRWKTRNRKYDPHFFAVKNEIGLSLNINPEIVVFNQNKFINW